MGPLVKLGCIVMGVGAVAAVPCVVAVVIPKPDDEPDVNKTGTDINKNPEATHVGTNPGHAKAGGTAVAGGTTTTSGTTTRPHHSWTHTGTTTTTGVTTTGVGPTVADDWTPLDRSGKVLSVDRGITWKVEGDRKPDVKADVYHTALFDYVIQDGMTFAGVPYDEKIIEELAKIFEKNTIIGVGHYSDEFMTSNKPYVKNFPIQFLDLGRASWGNNMAVAMSSSNNPTPGKTFDKISPNDFLVTAQLIMHEYGHHEIIYGSDLSMDKAEKAKLIAQNNNSPIFWPKYEMLIKEMKSDPLLAPYTKYFSMGGPKATSDQTTTPTEWMSPWGMVPKGAQAWGSTIYSYVFDEDELLTRLLSQMEGQLDPSHFTDYLTGLIDTLDSNAMHMAFPKHPLSDHATATHFINLFKKYIFGLTDKTLTGINVTNKSGSGIILTDPKALPHGETTYDFDLKQFAGWAMGQLTPDKFTDDEIKAVKKFFNNGTEAKKSITLPFESSSFEKHQVEFGLNKTIWNGRYSREEIYGNYFTLKAVPTFKDEVLGKGLAKFANIIRPYKVDLKIDSEITK